MQAEVADHAHEFARLVVDDERDARAAGAGAGGAPDAVHVVIARAGDVEVDHVRDAHNVDAARGHVGGDERVDGAGLEARERLLALRLGLVAVHRHRLHVACGQPFDESVGAALGTHEHERAPAIGVVQLRDEPRDLPLMGDRHEAVLDLDFALGRMCVLMTTGIGGVGLGDAVDLTLERRREQQRLALARGHLHDPVDDRAKAHIEHPVGLVEHEQLHATERDLATIDQIEQPSRRGDEDVGARGDPSLLDDPGAAIHGGDRQRAGVRDLAQVVDDLDRQLARGRQYKRRRAHVGALQALDHRDSERERLARSGR